MNFEGKQYTRLALLLVILILSSVFALTFGYIRVSIVDIVKIFYWRCTHPFVDLTHVQEVGVSLQQAIAIWELRLPRVFLAMISGGVFAVSGVVCQSIFRNPLADPFLLGTSSGAALGTIVGILSLSLLGLDLNLFYGYGVPLFGFISSLFVTLLIHKISSLKKDSKPFNLLLAGIAINSFLSALIGFFIFRANNVQLRDFFFWSMGSLIEASWERVEIISSICVPLLILINFFSYQLNTILLGEDESFLLGVDTSKIRNYLFSMIALMLGVVVSFCGVIGFVGLAGPHLARVLVGNNHRYLILGSIFSGGILIILSDLISRTIISETNIPIGIITSLIGTPVFLFLLFKSNKKIFC